MAASMTAMTAKQPEYHEDQDWRKLNIDVKRLKYQIANGADGASSPAVVQMKKDLTFAEDLLQEREDQLDQLGKSQEDLTETPEYQLKLSKQEEASLDARYKEQTAEFERLFDDAQVFESDERILGYKRELFNAMRTRIKQKNVERNVPGSIGILTHAFVPLEPHKDSRVLYTAIVLVLCSTGIGFITWLYRRKRVSVRLIS